MKMINSEAGRFAWRVFEMLFPPRLQFSAYPIEPPATTLEIRRKLLRKLSKRMNPSLRSGSPPNADPSAGNVTPSRQAKASQIGGEFFGELNKPHQKVTQT